MDDRHAAVLVGDKHPAVRREIESTWIDVRAVQGLLKAGWERAQGQTHLQRLANQGARSVGTPPPLCLLRATYARGADLKERLKFCKKHGVISMRRTKDSKHRCFLSTTSPLQPRASPLNHVDMPTRLRKPPIGPL